jgi:2-keto-4-pentenoate hydratase/2-oxohepta-3-ene-1,7-dioic acid hydratase in catechol pathway
MVSFASHITPLDENDVVALGDPGHPSIMLDSASSVTCRIESIGELTNDVRRL